ncbi:EamA family transporter RarD [Paenibacillus amylolyticus]|uniref:EamA family transporter RarD n=1 Tax=Paenibacillus amylolyticus TaxID=1451 RepID=UPI0039AEED06
MKFKQSNEQSVGVISGASAYIIWGILPVYWNLIGSLSAKEILAHRIVWSFVFMILVLVFMGKLKQFFIELCTLFKEPKKLFVIFAASIVISMNWYTYIWAVSNNHLVEASLGYYITPLVSILLGLIFLKEKLSFWSTVAFILASIGVLNMTLNIGTFPWVALSLAITFGMYGLLKKITQLEPMTGLTIETLIMAPFSLLFLGNLQMKNESVFTQGSPQTIWLLMGAGVITAVPLLLFAITAKRVSLAMIGFLQYIAPTIMLILGILLYHEPFNYEQISSFIFIWISLILYTLSKSKWFIKMEKKILYLKG